MIQMSNLPYPVRYKLPLQYLTVDDWNNFVNDLLFILNYGPGKWLQYYSNGNMSNLNVVRAKTGIFNDLEVAGYQALWNLKPVQAYTFGDVFSTWLSGLQNVVATFDEILDEIPTLKIPIYPKKTIPEAWLTAFQLYAEQLKKALYYVSRFKYRLYASTFTAFPPANNVGGLQTTISGTVNLASIVPAPLSKNARYALLRNLGTSPIQVNGGIFLAPGDTLRVKIIDIQVENLDEVVLTSSQPVPISLFVGNVIPQPVTKPPTTTTTVPTYAISVQNSQSDPTPSSFQLLLPLNLQGVLSSASVSSLLSLLFCSDQQCTSPLYAWIENYNSDLSTVNVWVLLPDGIPASSTITIYMQINGKNNYPYTGINAYYSTDYDNGVQVFDAYLNAMGSSIVSTSSITLHSIAYSSVQFTPQSGTTPGYITMIDNQECSFTTIYILAPKSQRLPEIFESVEYYSGVGTDEWITGLADTSSDNYLAGFIYDDSVAGAWIPSSNVIIIAGAGDDVVNGTCDQDVFPVGNGNTVTTTNYYQLIATSSGITFNGEVVTEPYEVDYSSVSELLSYSGSISAYGDGVGASDMTTNQVHVAHLYWLRARAEPPNNVMPTLVSMTKVS